MKLLFYILLSGGVFLSSTSIFAQETNTIQEEYENVRPFRLGVKSGIPNLLSANIEYVLPVLNRKFAVSADYSKISMDAGDFGFKTVGENEILEQEFDYLELGLHYYFFKPGKGLYAGITYSNYGLKGIVPNIAENQNEAIGNGYVDFSNNSVNIKAGAKWGGFFYFRPEIGYAFNPFPSSLPMRVEFEDGTTEDQELDLSADSGFLDLIYKGMIFNIGIGFSF